MHSPQMEYIQFLHALLFKWLWVYYILTCICWLYYFFLAKWDRCGCVFLHACVCEKIEKIFYFKSLLDVEMFSCFRISMTRIQYFCQISTEYLYQRAHRVVSYYTNEYLLFISNISHFSFGFKGNISRLALFMPNPFIKEWMILILKDRNFLLF